MNPAILDEEGRASSTGDPCHAPGITLSVVSHLQAAMLAQLLRSLCDTGCGNVVRVIVTHNLPEANVEPRTDGWPFELVERTNPAPLGFGANHNQAFALCETDQFCVINPDIVFLSAGAWPHLQAVLASAPEVGCTYPRLVNEDGTPQDQERAAPTPVALALRHFLRRGEAQRDWVSAAFWLLRADVFRALGGFDERFYMYCEDTEFCLRLQLHGWRLAAAPVRVMHAAARRSRSDGSHLAWHVGSLLRLWATPVLWRYLLQGRRRGR